MTRYFNGQNGLERSEFLIKNLNAYIVFASLMLLGRAFHELGAEWVKDLCPYRTVLILGITSVREFCDLSVLLGLYILSMSLMYRGDRSCSALYVWICILYCILYCTGNHII